MVAQETQQSDLQEEQGAEGEEDEDRQEEPEDEEDAVEGRGSDGHSGYPGSAEEWEEIFVCPLSIRFTQDKIHPFFYRRGPIVNVVPKIRLVDQARGDAVVDLIPPFSPIHCLRKGEEIWSMDNRRLYALQLAAMDLWPRRCRVRVLSRDRLPRHKFKTQYRKFNTTVGGRSIEVCTRYQQFDTWSWRERAVELERYSLSKRLGSMLFVFEGAPIVGALLYRSGLTGFSSRVPLVVGFCLAFAVDFIRQQVPIFERKISQTQVNAILAGEMLQFNFWWMVKKSEDDEDSAGIAAGQLAAILALALLLLLPYILAVTSEKLRSSLFSCWLGVAFMLAVQFISSWQSFNSGLDDEPSSNLRKLPKELREEKEGAEADGQEEFNENDCGDDHCVEDEGSKDEGSKHDS